MKAKSEEERLYDLRVYSNVESIKKQTLSNVTYEQWLFGKIVASLCANSEIQFFDVDSSNFDKNADKQAESIIGLANIITFKAVWSLGEDEENQ